MLDNRIYEHPILSFDRGKRIKFFLDGKELFGYENETIGAALHANGITMLSKSLNLNRPRGFFCGIGKCSSCLMTVNGVPNERTCILPLKEGMDIHVQEGKGRAINVRKDDKKVITEKCDVLIIGSGPAGLSAAMETTNYGLATIVVDENPIVGGQLIKQTHRFFGSEKEYAGVRGIDISPLILENCNRKKLKFYTMAGAFGYYPEGVAVELEDQIKLIKTQKVIVAGGAQENFLIFENNDLPGIYGAGGVQTLMNVYGVKPGNRALMVGSGNVGLIVSYQLLQAGVEVKCVVEVMDRIGGYYVHAAKLKRQGVPILLRHTIEEAIGNEKVEGAVVRDLESGEKKCFEVDLICIAVGLTPSVQLLQQAGCKTVYIPELGGEVALHGECYETTVHGLYVVGDTSAIEEASSAMLEGRIAGISVSLDLDLNLDIDLNLNLNHLKATKEALSKREELRKELHEIRDSPFGKKIVAGEEKMKKLVEAYYEH